MTGLYPVSFVNGSLILIVTGYNPITTTKQKKI